MAKVLVIRKPDRTIHKVPLQNKATLMNFNNRLPQNAKWTFEEMEEEDAAKLPFIDSTYVTAAEAQDKVKKLEQSDAEKDAKIKELEAKLAALSGIPDKPKTAVEVIALINDAKTADEVKAIAEGDTRATVQKAAEEKIASFN